MRESEGRRVGGVGGGMGGVMEERWEGEGCEKGWELECDKGMLESERLMIGVKSYESVSE